MKLDILDFGQGRIQYFDLTGIDFSRPAQGQLDELKEDLVQVEYKGGILLDIGWYPSFSPDGSFVVTVVQDADWDEPLLREECDNWESLRTAVQHAVSVAQSSSSSSREGGEG